MRERVVHATRLGQFVPAVEVVDVNAHGYDPIGDQVLVLPDKAAETIGTMGTILAPDQTKSDLTLATQTGILVAHGEGAWLWNGDRMRAFVGRKPVIGDRVVFNKYGGKDHVGEDGLSYLIMDDKAVLAIKRAQKEPANG